MGGAGNRSAEALIQFLGTKSPSKIMKKISNPYEWSQIFLKSVLQNLLRYICKLKGLVFLHRNTSHTNNYKVFQTVWCWLKLLGNGLAAYASSKNTRGAPPNEHRNSCHTLHREKVFVGQRLNVFYSTVVRSARHTVLQLPKVSQVWLWFARSRGTAICSHLDDNRGRMFRLAPDSKVREPQSFGLPLRTTNLWSNWMACFGAVVS